MAVVEYGTHLSITSQPNHKIYPVLADGNLARNGEHKLGRKTLTNAINQEAMSRDTFP